MANPNFRSVAEGFFVAPHLTLGDIKDAGALGIKTIIDNRPDEEDPHQLQHEDAARAADELGIAFAYIPVVSGAMSEADIAAMREVVEAAEKPILAYCRTGTRCTFLWAFLEAEKRPVEDVLQMAGNAGYDISAARPVLERVHNKAG